MSLGFDAHPTSGPFCHFRITDWRGDLLTVEALFSVAHLILSRRPTTIAPTHCSWDYTSVLNIVILAMFGVLYWLYLNRGRLGGGQGYAIDVVCGMQVRSSGAPAEATHDAKRFYFCSDRCRERFEADPERFAHRLAGTAPVDMASGVIDPVCGMSVDPETADHHRHRLLPLRQGMRRGFRRRSRSLGAGLRPQKLRPGSPSDRSLRQRSCH